MIADSVEAASRTAVSATKEEFAEIIDRIIQNKISEEQFHEAPLTLGELAIVRKAFLDVLVSTYHERPHYPTMQETRALESQAAKNAGSPQREVSVQTRSETRSVSKKTARKTKRTKAAVPQLID